MDETIKSKLLEYLDAIESGVTNIAPAAYDTAISMVQFSAVASLIQTLVFVVMAIGAFFTVKWSYRVCAEQDEKCRDGDLPPALFIAVPATVTLAVGLIGTFGHLMSKTMWIGLFNPEAGLAWMIFRRVLAPES